MLPCLVVLLAALLSLRLGSDAHVESPGWLALWQSGARVLPYSGKPGSQAHLLWKWKRLKLTGTDGLGRIEKYAQGQTPNPQTSSSTHF
ncbi:interleukin 10 receptor subunit alpha [Homo sapiens]|uniref:Interleukin 10 receptor subunit alpha n=1 Tax=Homo sapiens TaxID=9606 RepID=E9PPU4_HUMAN|nr:interleukin 10 receptor subunit alpha [Homo sapiens]KAI4074362.1 interleukin 10 receptor subunit alpha [Homo sapiens]